MVAVEEHGDGSPAVIRTPDQRLRVFVSSTLEELAEERVAAKNAISHLRLTPVLFELGARPHPPRPLYRAYVAQSDIFIGIYWQRYGWVAPGEDISGLEDEYRLAVDRPKLIYVKDPSPEREPQLTGLLDTIQHDDRASYKFFTSADELRELIENDLALVLSESFAQTQLPEAETVERRPPANLPVQRTALVDRVTETAAIRDLLMRADVGLVTLTGVGGTGKTRLALHVATTLRDFFEDGIVFVPLAPIEDPTGVIPAIAQALDVREGPGRALGDSIQEYLHARHLLLVLDNFEHLLDAAPLVGRLLETSSRLTILTTSRALLHLREEKELRIPPLALPDDRPYPELAYMSQYAAVELFIQRARDVKPDFVVTNQTAPAVAEICRRLDGLPLAIELAAARIKLFPPRALLARLERRLPLLTTGARDLPERQQTLRGAVEWSYDLLDEEEKRLFRRLSVFVGGFTLDDAANVCQDCCLLPGVAGEDLHTDPFSIPAVVESLLDKSLLWVEEGRGGEPRFGMLETIREYGRLRLAEGSEEAEMLSRHAQSFLLLVQEAEPDLTSARRAAALDLLTTEQDNLRAVLRRTLKERKAPDVGVQMAMRLSWFWFLRGQLSEGLEWLRLALALTDVETQPVERAKLLYGIGGMAWGQSDFITAQSAFEESVALLRQVGDSEAPSLARSLTSLGLNLSTMGEANRAKLLLTEAVDLHTGRGDSWWEAFALYHLGDANLRLGDLSSAEASYRHSLTIYEELQDTWGQSVVLFGLGILAAMRNQPREAHELFQKALSLSDEMYNRARAATGAASALSNLEDYDRAKDLWKESLGLWRELGNLPYTIVSLAGLAGLELRMGMPAPAARLFGAVTTQLNALDARDAAIVTGLYAEVCQASLTERLATSRATLDRAGKLTVWEEGASMSLEQAVLFARYGNPVKTPGASL